MSWFNYHTHTNFCEGKCPPELFVKAAIQKNFISLGFSSRVPAVLPHPTSMYAEEWGHYLRKINTLRNTYEDKISIYTGAEIDYTIRQRPERLSLLDTTDYTIGSVRYVDYFKDDTPWAIDGHHLTFLRGLKEIYRYDIKRVISHYYALYREMIKTIQPTIVAHLDIIKVQNWDQQFYREDEKWYYYEVMATLETIKEFGSILEVNTRGLYKRRTLDLFPSQWILELVRDMEIPITLSCEAHHPDELKLEYKKTASRLVELGFGYLHVIDNGVWVAAPFDGLGIRSTGHSTRSRVVA